VAPRRPAGHVEIDVTRHERAKMPGRPHMEGHPITPGQASAYPDASPDAQRQRGDADQQRTF
jgi:hypothetical protein